MPETPLELLKRVFGFGAFRGPQADIVDCLIQEVHRPFDPGNPAQSE